MKFTEDEKDLLMALADSPYYSVVAKMLQVAVDAQSVQTLKEQDKESLWNEKMRLEGVLRVQRDIIGILADARKAISGRK